MPERTAPRVAQLAKGVEGAAAALPTEHAALRERAVAAAARARSAAGSTGEDRLAELLRCLERLHWALLRIDVLEKALEETEVEEALAELEAMVPAGAPPGAAAAEESGP